MGAVRRVAAWLPAVVVVPAVLAAGVWVTAPEKDEETAARVVLPLEVGTTWVYAVSDHGSPSGTRTRQVTSQAPVDLDTLTGVAMSSHYTDYPGVGDTSDLTYLVPKDGEVLQYGVVAGTRTAMLDPPVPLYRYPPATGDSWSYTGRADTVDVTLEVELLGFEDVEVGGRGFSDCAHYRTSQHIGADSPEEVIEEWTCPGVGPVRTRHINEAGGLDITEELVSFHSPDAGWDAEDPATVVAATGQDAAGTAAGLDPARSNHLADGDPGPTLRWSDIRTVTMPYAPVGAGRLMVTGESDGEVSAVDVTTGDVLWRLRLRGPIATTPAIAGDLALAADSAKNLWALDLATGATRWVHHFPDVVTASPAVAARSVVVATDDARVTALSLSDGTTVWRVNAGARVSAAPALSGDLAVVADRAASLTAYDVATGRRAWTRSLDQPVEAFPAIGEGAVVLADTDGTVLAFDLSTGHARWQARSHYFPTGAFAVGDGLAVVRAGNHRLEGYDLRTGDQTWSVSHPDFRAAPLIVGDQVVSVTRDGTVQVRSAASGALVRRWSPPPSGATTTWADAGIGLVGDTLVVSAALLGDGLAAGLWAYPLHGDSKTTAGMAFSVQRRILQWPLQAPAVMSGDTLFAATVDGSLYRSTGRSAREVLFTADGGLVPGVAADGDLVVAQQDDQYLGLDLHGDERWRVSAAAAFPGTIPAIAGDTVYLPQRGVGLEALDRGGTRRWISPITSDLGSTTPLPLPGGDVVYGVGQVARYAAATGEPVWTLADAVLFSTAAYDGGQVFADLARADHPAGLAAIDAATGEIRWTRPNVAQQVFVGPAADDGVVVYTDSTGLVTALDATNGAELWHLRVDTPLAGTPVVTDGRVYLVEQGYQQDLNQRAARVTAYDARSGAFLGAYQPSGTNGTSGAVVGLSPTGDLLVPGVGGGGYAVLALTPEELVP